ncbi:MAG: glycogen synthase [Opitutae bacterium]|nr:glycogen synthase [Opitutae bacterium]
MKVLFVAPELPPFAKIGGLGDVVGALSKALLALGVEVKVFCPLYGGITIHDKWLPNPKPLHIDLGDHSYQGRLWEGPHPDTKVPLVFLEYNDYFQREGVYGSPNSGDSFGDNGQRFSFFSRAAIDLCHHLEWFPDVIHCHDWTVGLLPRMLKRCDTNSPLYKTPTVLTLHNLEHQGVFPSDVANYAGLLDENSSEINFLQNGIIDATVLTTVSPTYSREIQQIPGGFGMEALLRKRSSDLHGIINGIDTQEWNPAQDSALPIHFSSTQLSAKASVKSSLQDEMDLPQADATPLFGVVSRLYHQKGLDLLTGSLPHFLRSNPKSQFVILGSGDSGQVKEFENLSLRFPGNVAVTTRFDEGVARRIYGGSDFFVMPSRFEPCGLSQLYAMRYGSVPIVRNTGGLADTVFPFDQNGRGTGIVFQDASSSALEAALIKATGLYATSSIYKSVQLNAMKLDSSWNKPGGIYLEIYQNIVKTAGN